MLTDEDNAFATQLPRSLQQDYLKQKSEKIKITKEEFEKIKDEYFSKRDKGIKLDKYHKEVLNSCIFPFVQTSSFTTSLDYVYIRSSPLSELKVKNVDFLIASQSKGIAIFGEAKGTIEDPSAVISEYRKRIDTINQNLDKVRNFVPNLSRVEYVLCVPSMDAMNTIKSILRSNINLILWETGGIGKQELSLVVPPNVNETIRNTVMHSDNDLNRALSKIPTSAEYKTFFHESHPVTKLELLTALGKGEDDFFTFEKVKKIVEDELDNTSEVEVKQIALDIIRLGISINFVNCKSNGNYKIQSIYKNSKSRYDELKRKWIEHRYQQDIEKKTNDEILKIQQEFDRKRNEQGSLETFFE